MLPALPTSLHSIKKGRPVPERPAQRSSSRELALRTTWRVASSLPPADFPGNLRGAHDLLTANGRASSRKSLTYSRAVSEKSESLPAIPATSDVGWPFGCNHCIYYSVNIHSNSQMGVVSGADN